MWWNNVETKPGTGYPTAWEDQDKYKGGFKITGKDFKHGFHLPKHNGYNYIDKDFRSVIGLNLRFLWHIIEESKSANPAKEKYLLRFYFSEEKTLKED